MRNINKDQKWDEIFLQFSDKEFKHPDTGLPIFQRKRDYLCFLALLGLGRGERTPISKRSAPFDYRLFEDEPAAMDVIFFVGMADRKDATILDESNEDELILIFEEYVNTGFKVLHEWMLQRADDPHGDQAIITGLLNDGLTDSGGGDIDLSDVF